MKDNSKNNQKKYNPNVGFIGQSEVSVANYLFSAKRTRKAYQHAKPIADRLMSNDVSGHYSESKRLTKFLKNRDLTFSKKMSSGEYKTFTVPCTTTVVPFEKSLFNEVEEAAQVLLISLRGVIQDIYGSKSLESSKFIKSLPDSVRDIFIHAIKTSSNYFPQLHHPNMKSYPFLDNVGLDLVLVEDYLTKAESFPAIIGKGAENELPGLPFRILELNAGSPSGASNNMNVLEGIYEQTPEILDTLGKMMPNDHFKILGETYKSLGESWTKRKDGIQILLPPGGQNGAAPEIHQLAAYSGLIYAEADQLYQDEEGYIRLRTVSKDNPIVNAIYSRINADSALFDPEKKLYMKDPDSAEPIYLTDDLILDEEGEGKRVTDSKGNPIPLQSAYAIPGIIQAIIDKKIYMGGLNRILDNKIILATLTHYAPKYYSKRVESAGIKTNGKKLMPPQTLPPTKRSVEIIEQNPDEWVVKAPSLAGGQGVYILKTMSKQKKEEILDMIRKTPDAFAYQQLVRIARIPVAVQRKSEGFKFANLAADIRTWVFFGGGKDAKPVMSHNALVRYAPQEKGKMSSIVNTSAGGGYAPFVIVDDIDSKNSVTAKELTKPLDVKEIKIELPVFVAAQMVQIGRMLRRADKLLTKPHTYTLELLKLTREMRDQLKEILSFVHPRSIESIYKVIDLLEARVSKTESKDYKQFVTDQQLNLVQTLKTIDTTPYIKGLRDQFDNIRALNIDTVLTSYTPEHKALDLVIIDDLISSLNDVQDDQVKLKLTSAIKIVKDIINTNTPDVLLGNLTKRTLRSHFEDFCTQARQRLLKSPKIASYAELFRLDADVTELKFETLYLGKKDTDKEIKVASQLEMRTGITIGQSDLISDELKSARESWLKIVAKASKVAASKRDAFLNKERSAHFKAFPKLQRYQELINSNNVAKEDLIELLDVLPYAKFNIESFAKEQGVTIENVFTKTLRKDRISLLSETQIKKNKISNKEYAGECFAKKNKSHGLYSDSSIFVWIKKDLNPFVMLYTAGHELIHYQQIKNSMEAEKRAIKDGGISMAKFLNYYGNFLGANQRTLDSISFEMQSERKPLYGYQERIEKDSDKPVMKELDLAVRESDFKWEQKLEEFGSLFGYMMKSKTGTRVKALQEVIPALENAKNIIFATELGLIVDINPVKAALPAANDHQVQYYSEDIIKAATSANANWESLRVIASHQYHGVSFCRADNEEDNLSLIPGIDAVAVGSSYNQTQQ